MPKKVEEDLSAGPQIAAMLTRLEPSYSKLIAHVVLYRNGFIGYNVARQAVDEFSDLVTKQLTKNDR